MINANIDAEPLAIIHTPSGELNINGYMIKIPGAVKAIVFRSFAGAETVGVYISAMSQNDVAEYDAFENKKGGKK
ncbi:MAG: hypothetical protein LBO72_08770 [Helicobacteraceae bacterium]|jgi:hypothetical protein|nr:hypothetical protein [Helicobacteraceae bacterium]